MIILPRMARTYRDRVTCSQAYRDRAGHEDPRVPFGLKHFRSPRYQEGSVNSVHLLGREEKILEGKLARRTVLHHSTNKYLGSPRK